VTRLNQTKINYHTLSMRLPIYCVHARVTATSSGQLAARAAAQLAAELAVRCRADVRAPRCAAGCVADRWLNKWLPKEQTAQQAVEYAPLASDELKKKSGFWIRKK